MPVSKHRRNGVRRHTHGTFGSKVNGKPTGPRRVSKFQYLVNTLGRKQALRTIGKA